MYLWPPILAVSTPAVSPTITLQGQSTFSMTVTVTSNPRRHRPKREHLWVYDVAGVQAGVIT